MTNLEKERRNRIEEEGEDVRGQPLNYQASHCVKVKVKHTKMRKGKSSEAKGIWDNFRKYGYKPTF